ncbi:MAG: phenylacetate--CoA ligase family protein, partial [Phycisphaerales bacterium]|nr:phenylacetate--CoA ligase family protein [Phycisphaerales bacterium]
MGFHEREIEELDRAGLAELQRGRLAELFRIVRQRNGFYRKKLENAGVASFGDAVRRGVFTTREEIQEDQRLHAAYGSNLTYGIDRYVRVHETSGSAGRPVRWLDTAESWAWWKHCWSIIYGAAGVTACDRCAFTFSFGPFIGFWGAFESAVALGCCVLPCGGMTTSARLRYVTDHGATVVCCTPTYALRMAEVAADEGIDLRGSAVRALIVAGEPGGSIPATRARIGNAWGARVFDHAGMTVVGPWGFECAERSGGMHVMESEFVAEVVEPATGRAVEGGEAG